MKMVGKGIIAIISSLAGAGVGAVVSMQFIPKKTPFAVCVIQTEIVRANLPEWAQYQAAFLNTYKRWPRDAAERDAYEAEMKAKGISGIDAIHKSEAQWVTW